MPDRHIRLLTKDYRLPGPIHYFYSAMDQHLDIKQFIFELSEIPSSDPLVNIDVSKKEVIAIVPDAGNKWILPLDTDWNRVLKTAVQNKREADLDSLCLVSGSIAWIYKDKEVVSPLLLVPVSWKIRKADNAVELIADSESVFVNPFVKNRFLRDFDLNLAKIIDGDTAAWLDELTGLLQSKKLPVRTEALSAIGNFHHHRYRILRELELLQQSEERSELVETILGNESESNGHTLQLSSGLLSPADADQLKVFEQITKKNTVIQGPPGTGKSQVLMNLLGKCLDTQGLTLVVSEKRVALEVLVKKLAGATLDPFTFLVHSQTKPRDFIQKLKAAWSALEKERAVVPPSLLLSEQLKAQLQLTMDKLNMPSLVGGVSFGVFRKLLAETDTKNGVFSSDVPGLDEWIRFRPQMEDLESALGTFAVFTRYKQPLFATAHFDRILAKLRNETEFFRAAFPVETLADLEKLQASVARCQLVANETFKSYFGIYRQPKELKRFRKMQLRFGELQSKLALLEAETAGWKTAPSRSQAASWLKQLPENQSWFAKRTFRKNIRPYLSNDSIDLEIALTNWLAYLDAQEEKIALESQFAAWGIHRPELELESAAYVLRQLEQEDPNELNRVAAMSATERKAVTDHAQRLQQFLQDLNRYCVAQPESLLSDLFSGEETTDELLPHLQAISKFPPALFRMLASGKPLKEIQASVLHSNWLLVEARFPALAKFDGTALGEKLEAILETEEQEFAEFAQMLWSGRKMRFDSYAAILRTPAAQLKGDQKMLKATLKAGKAILVKEFGKSKQHKTIRELLAGEARTWIELLTPVWLSTPAQLGTTFPMERGLFNLAIFDESSQIPLPNALGALQRAKRAVVAGDEQQMAPTSYFSGGTAAVDLLHQAAYHWGKVPLTHHYRSVHPALIAFSNRHFYNDALVAYPAAKAPFPLHRHFVGKGVYEDRMNVQEAREVAAFLETVSWKQTVGVAAFSEQQLECIREACSPEVREKITAGQENATVFFKALEQIQGDECDLLVVSMGYGKNADGEFHLRFGPLNQGQGHKRLNVLLTRARKELHFFTSVEAADLRISSNESVNLLRLFLQQLEQPSDAKTLELPYGLTPKSAVPSSLTLPAVFSTITSARELVTFHRIMSARGWRITYD